MSRVALLTPPMVEPLDLAETKEHLRVEHDREDQAILRLIRTAREACEQHTRRALIEQRRELRLDRPPSLFKFHRMVPLPYPPLIAVEAVVALGDLGEETMLAPSEYQAISGGEGLGRVAFRNLPWAPGGLLIRYLCGYGSSAEYVPDSLRQGMLLVIAHWYENREATSPGIATSVPFGADALWRPYRVVSL